MRKKILPVLLVVLLLLLLFQTQAYRFKPKRDIPAAIKAKLHELGEQALLSNDVPVAALVLYHDSIIGEGYNTVQRDSVISGHAEIMALSQAFKNQGNSFNALNRNELVLYSTFEPCEMCKGAMLHYGIRHVYFEETKPVFSQVKSTLKSLLYNLSLTRLDAEGLQQELFEKHPAYPGKH